MNRSVTTFDLDEGEHPRLHAMLSMCGSIPEPIRNVIIGRACGFVAANGNTQGRLSMVHDATGSMLDGRASLTVFRFSTSGADKTVFLTQEGEAYTVFEADSTGVKDG